MVSNGDTEHGTTKTWQYTWEAQSHTPTLRLLLFATDGNFNPSLQCRDPGVTFNSSRSIVVVAWSESDADGVSHTLRIPVPRVLVDGETPMTFRLLSDHIEMKLRLLLPVDHPILSEFDSVLNLSDEPPSLLPEGSRPLVIESDVKSLSSRGGVDFYCRRCSFKLNRYPLRDFVELPSANWREVADNWFGACCCSFGSISEKLVIRYVDSYTCSQGICLLSSTSITLCKDDLVEFNFPEGCGQEGCNFVANDPGDDDVCKATKNSGLTKGITSTSSDAGEVVSAFDENSRFALPENELFVNFGYEDINNKLDNGDFSNPHLDSNHAEDVSITHGCCIHKISVLGDEEMEILGNQKSFLNGFLEDIFMARSSNLSKDIVWHEFTCPQCTSLLGAFPCYEGYTPVDGGIRLFKSYISTCVPVGGLGDMFSKYTIDRMFANQLVECAKDESSFRFVIRELKTKSPVLQIVLLNPDTWSCFGNCSDTENEDLDPKIQLHPIVKVLFSDCSTAREAQLRMIEEWVTKNSAENIFMQTYQIQEVVCSLMSAKKKYPASCGSLQSLVLSSLQR